MGGESCTVLRLRLMCKLAMCLRYDTWQNHASKYKTTKDDITFWVSDPKLGIKNTSLRIFLSIGDWGILSHDKRPREKNPNSTIKDI